MTLRLSLRDQESSSEQHEIPRLCGPIEYSDEDGLFVGLITGIKDLVGFHGTSVAELRGAFQGAEVDYLETCVRLDRVAQKPYS